MREKFSTVTGSLQIQKKRSHQDTAPDAGTSAPAPCSTSKTLRRKASLKIIYPKTRGMSRSGQCLCRNQARLVWAGWYLLKEGQKMALDNFIPRNSMARCLKCRKHRGKFTCEVYPTWIPNEVTDGDCPDFEEKEKDEEG